MNDNEFKAITTSLARIIDIKFENDYIIGGTGKINKKMALDLKNMGVSAQEIKKIFIWGIEYRNKKELESIDKEIKEVFNNK